MIILSAKLFLRADEVVTLKPEKSFKLNMCTVDENGFPTALAVSIKGKL
jgi:hypothetical protein